ncbi:MAG: hypothetical protein ACR2ML_12140 [Solirubrobacteraceae bacterium]
MTRTLPADTPTGPPAPPPGSGGRRTCARDLGLLLLGLVALCALAYGPHVLDGGFYWDDWQLAARVRFPPGSSPDFSGPIDLGLLAYRPLLALLLPAVHLLLGPRPELHILLGLALNVATAACFFAFLRELGIERGPAGLMAALALIFPWSDSMRLWATAAINSVGVLLFLLAMVAALRGLRARGRGRGGRLTVLALVLLALGVLTYEVAAAAALLSVFLYRREVGWGAAVRRWGLDALVVVAATAWVALNTPRSMESLRGLIDHGLDVLDDSVTLLARAVEPFGAPPRGIALTGVAVLVLGALLVRGRLPATAPARGELGRWLAVAGAAVVGVLASYALIVPADRHYLPFAPGVNNRINLLAALPYATLVVALSMIAATLAFARRAPRPWAPMALAVLLCSVVGVGWLDRTVENRRDWDRAAAEQERVLAALERAVPPDRPPSSTVYSFGVRQYVREGIPVFSVSWDLKGAARLRLDDRTLRAFSIAPEGRLACRGSGVEPLGSAYDRNEAAVYGRALFVDVRTARAAAIENSADCRRERARMSSAYR